MTPEEIAAARESLNVSQPVFARLLNVPTVTAASWEKGRRKPSGAAFRLLQIVRKHPELLLGLGITKQKDAAKYFDIFPRR
jgi:putative transcriptional regulator